ncbi:3-hydroxyacyl-CoA dehydrogenase NAD-binding domain-containing protein [Cellulosimicrobium cellulans]|uniref:3-hydroxyacyl-CoA dehydrogenase NAD-binding domain-containing protein n=1 Tax=Cellulosimicrobium cellulans TaxID=1710 RepID=UPI0016527FDE|nr:3-hydroxyacyl-CoA dehydrogenase NAD-binding domain-containing protein [Cellulosimicrobium cellulans]
MRHAATEPSPSSAPRDPAAPGAAASGEPAAPGAASTPGATPAPDTAGALRDLPAEADDHVLRVATRDVELPDGAGVLALLTLTATDERRPTTLGPRGLTVLREALDVVRARAEAGEIAAVAVTGRPGCFVAGADLSVARRLDGLDQTRALAEAGHAALRPLGELPVPTFAWITGHALGGGLELALHCDHRVAAAGIRSIGLPEASLGIVPGWGGSWLLPRLVGLPAAVDLAVLRPLANNRLTSAEQALELGLVDSVLPVEGFEQSALAWTAGVLRAGSPDRRAADVPPVPAGEPDPVTRAAATLDARLHGAAPAYAHVLDLLARAGSRDREAGFRAEDDALSRLLASDEARAALYAAELTGRGARRAARTEAGDAAPREVRRVGIVGAGLMAAQLAVLLGSRLGVPVAMREVDEDRAAAGRERVRDLVESAVSRGRLPEDAGRALLDGVRVGTDLADLADADLVIEAVTEVLDVKRAVFAELETLVRPDCVLATNTSALSVTAMAEGLAHPERVVGLHFFNPVAQMPLVEVVATASSDPASLATAVDVARRAGKTVVRTTDRPGFVVNRVLLRMLADVLGAVEDGTPVEAADAALRPLGLPMSPFALLQLVGLPVARHVLVTLHDELGDRYPLSPGLDALVEQGRGVAVPGPAGLAVVDPAIQDAFGAPEAGGTRAEQEAAVLDRVARGLAEEIGSLLDEGVVPSADQVDLAMLLGAGWPAHLGGICPWLDRTGWSERLLGRRLLPPGVADASAAVA